MLVRNGIGPGGDVMSIRKWRRQWSRGAMLGVGLAIACLVQMPAFAGEAATPFTGAVTYAPPAPTGTEASGLQLVMFQQVGCPWCAEFNSAIAPGYAKSTEGKAAPLRRVDIHQPIPADLAGITVEPLTPVFVVVDNGKEIGRIRGYPGADFFWFLLDQVLAKVPHQS
jgi:hypothetical protein